LWASTSSPAIAGTAGPQSVIDFPVRLAGRYSDGARDAVAGLAFEASRGATAVIENEVAHYPAFSLCGCIFRSLDRLRRSPVRYFGVAAI